MSCEKADGLLHAYLDGELDPAGAADFERHLPGCAACTRELEAQQALRARLREAGLYAPAPAALMADVRRALRRPGLLSPARWRWLGAAAAAVLVSASLWTWSAARREAAVEGVANAAVDAHLRSLQLTRLTDVASTDTHTVKPWFVGRLSYSPPVVDLAADGFPLVGGRLDVVQGRTVAALVYARRNHVVNVFVWPAEGGGEAAPRSSPRRGYDVVRWSRGGMQYWAVSDVAPSDLDELVRLLRR